ncbi:hypothetical protein H0X10_03965 [Candidatus Saccharibacteria bacterium]|nr:hypothetical protein [Candidatus Saccharibacteria bacterium]
MSESEPKVRFYLVGEMPKEDFTEIIAALGSRMLGEVRMGQGELDLLQDQQREALKHTVSVQAARDFYLHLFQDKTPSPLATSVTKEIGRVVPAEATTHDKKDNFTGILRPAWDAEVKKIYEGTSKLKYKPGTKKRQFLEAFDAYLPKTD